MSNTAADRLRNRIAHLSTRMLLETYAFTGRAFDADPQGPNSSAHTILLSVLDMELLKRDVPCCSECAVPDALGFHLATLHTQDEATNAIADALTDAAVAVAASDPAAASTDVTWDDRCRNAEHRHTVAEHGSCDYPTVDAYRAALANA